jgi:hypothetical protein
VNNRGDVIADRSFIEAEGNAKQIENLRTLHFWLGLNPIQRCSKPGSNSLEGTLNRYAFAALPAGKPVIAEKPGNTLHRCAMRTPCATDLMGKRELRKRLLSLSRWHSPN